MKREFIKDKNEIVQKDWHYAYYGGGFPMIIPEEAPVQKDMIGKPAHEASMAWGYFMKPVAKFTVPEYNGSWKRIPVIGPISDDLYFDYDDVNHDEVDKNIQKILKILNEHWDD